MWMEVMAAVRELGYKNKSNIYAIIAQDKRRDRHDRYKMVRGRMYVDISKLYYQEEVSFEEIGKRLGLSRDEVRAAYQSGVRKIKERLEI